MFRVSSSCLCLFLPLPHQSLLIWLTATSFQPFFLALSSLLSISHAHRILLSKALFCSPQLASSVTQSCPTLCDPMNCSTPASLSNSQSSPKPMSIELVMPSSHLILCHPLLLLPPIPPSIRVFSSESTLLWGGQSIGVSAWAPVLPVNTQDWSPLERTNWISLQSRGLSRVFSNTTVQKHQFFGWGRIESDMTEAA